MNIVEALHRRHDTTLNRPFFKTLIILFICINPFAVGFQLYSAATIPSLESVSIWTWIFFFAFQVATAVEGVRVNSSVMFWAMLVSACESFAIIVLVLVRG